MDIKNICKFCSINDNFSFAFYCNVFISEKAFICWETLTVFQNVMLLTKTLKYQQSKPFV